MLISNICRDGLTLSGARQGIFTLMSLLDQILSDDFFFKNFQTLLVMKIKINRVILTPCPAHLVFKKLPLDCCKDELSDPMPDRVNGQG